MRAAINFPDFDLCVHTGGEKGFNGKGRVPAVGSPLKPPHNQYFSFRSESRATLRPNRFPVVFKSPREVARLSDKWPTLAAWAQVAPTGFSKVAASSPDGKPAGSRTSRARFPRQRRPPTPPSRPRRAAGGSSGNSLFWRRGGAGSAPHLGFRALPSAEGGERGRRALPREGGGLLGAHPSPLPVLLAPRGGSFQEELRARPHHRAHGHVK